MDIQWSDYDEYEDKCWIDFHGYCPHTNDQWARKTFALDNKWTTCEALRHDC